MEDEGSASDDFLEPNNRNDSGQVYFLWSEIQQYDETKQWWRHFARRLQLIGIRAGWVMAMTITDRHHFSRVKVDTPSRVQTQEWIQLMRCEEHSTFFLWSSIAVRALYAIWWSRIETNICRCTARQLFCTPKQLSTAGTGARHLGAPRLTRTSCYVHAESPPRRRLVLCVCKRTDDGLAWRDGLLLQTF